MFPCYPLMCKTGAPQSIPSMANALIFPKFNINIYTNIPGAHDVSPWYVFCVTKTVLFNSFLTKSVSTRTAPIDNLGSPPGELSAQLTEG